VRGNIASDLHRLPDAQLVTLTLAGSQPSFQEIVRRYERPVFNLICRIVRDPALAEDLTQDVFLKTYRSLTSFDRSRRFASWILRIANNAALDAVRRRRSHPLVEGDPEDLPIPQAADPVEIADLGEALSGALDALRPEWRAAIVLRYQEGSSYEEIAEILGIPEGTAKTFVHRARKQMASALAAAGWRP
jgi:RNA polymerase sigma-70 factor, ECF subfamily